MTIRFHRHDLPDLSNYDVGAIAIDTETLGLNPHRDRLCVVQISPGDGTADVIQIARGQKKAPNLVALSQPGREPPPHGGQKGRDAQRDGHPPRRSTDPTQVSQQSRRRTPDTHPLEGHGRRVGFLPHDHTV